MDKIIRLIKTLVDHKFWGTIEIRFENGVAVHIRKTENIKL
jgi:hypothetical protein